MLNQLSAMEIMDETSGAPLLADRSSSTSSTKRKKTYIVIGGSGFLGSHLVEHLLNCDHNVIALDTKYPPNDILCQIEQSVKSKFLICDITNYNAIYRIFKSIKKQKQQDTQNNNNNNNNDHNDSSTESVNSLHSISSCSDMKSYKIECVFHCAAVTDAWAPPSLYENVNVNGTQNVIRACQECNITKLVYTSSSCVVLDGSDCQNGDESMKYVSKKNHLNYYSYSKQKAEELVLLANNSKCDNDKFNLLTCALRPHCIFGPRDTHFISQIINKARHGKITHMVGEGHNITDFTYIDNVVHAHILASKGLKISHPVAAGQVYFITNGEPTLFWSFLGAILQQLGCPRPTKSISYNVAYAVALIMEFIYMIIGWIFGWRPIITRQMVCHMACHHWFSHAKATRDLGYKPIVTLDHGIKKTVQYLQLHRRRRRYTQNGYISISASESTESLRSLRSISDTSIHHQHINLKNHHKHSHTQQTNINYANNIQQQQQQKQQQQQQQQQQSKLMKMKKMKIKEQKQKQKQKQKQSKMNDIVTVD